MDDELASMLPMIAAGYYVYIFVVMAFFFSGRDNLEQIETIVFFIIFLQDSVLLYLLLLLTVMS